MKRLLLLIFLSALAAPLAVAATNHVNSPTAHPAPPAPTAHPTPPTPTPAPPHPTPPDPPAPKPPTPTPTPTPPTSIYINYGVVNVVSPPEVAPQIDATTFVNYGTFWITNVYDSDTMQPPLPYETWDTLNWTNASQMAGDSGFRFDYYNSSNQINSWSANFQNAGNVNVTNANIFGASYLLVSATNINEKGTMIVSGTGRLSLSGKKLDLSRGSLGAVGNETNNLAGVQDLYWGDGVSFGGVGYNGIEVESSPLPVTTIQFPLGMPPQYVQILQDLLFTNLCITNIGCTNGFTIYAVTNPVSWTPVPGPAALYAAIDVLFLRQTNPAITTDVRFGNPFGNPGTPGLEKIIQWQALQTNRVNGAVTTNQLFLDDTFGDWGEPPTLAPTPWPIFNYTMFAAARYRPVNYSITHAAPALYATLPTQFPIVLDPSAFDGTNSPPISTNVGWAATITAPAFPPDPTIQGATWTNVPGRVEVSASGASSYLDLSWTRMDGQSYLLLNSTNHFVGCTNAAIISPVSDVYFHSTNGMMAISNLTTPFVPRMNGEIQAWSGRWTNVTAAGLGTLYTVTVVDSALGEKTPSLIQNLSLSSTNLLIGDALNVFGSLLLDTLRLTITTNALHAPTPYGTLNLMSSNLLWTASLPKLQYLTNFGVISTLNSAFFAGARTPPWFTGTFTEPYQALVTHGLLQAQGDSIWATYFEASGTNSAGVGPISVQANTAIVTNGIFLATDADITFTCGSLFISNQVLTAGRSIGLTITNYLDDGSLSNTVSVTTSQNVWTVGGGINLWRLPPRASLLATTVTNNAYNNAEVDNHWAAKDYGCSPKGFANNAALGQLILDGQDSGSLLAFWRITNAPSATNALYVDQIIFMDAATNFIGGVIPGTLDALGVYLDQNFTIYYGDAIVNGHSVAEKLNGGYGYTDTNGGHFCWVSNYNTGFFSSTNVLYTDGTGTHQLNRALVYSCDINSNGQPYGPTGGANASCPPGVIIFKPNPIPIVGSMVANAPAVSTKPLTVTLTAVYTNHPAPAMVLSWNTVPLATNYLYASSSLLPPMANWQLVTNFVSPATVGWRPTVTDPLKANNVRHYRVLVQAP